RWGGRDPAEWPGAMRPRLLILAPRVRRQSVGSHPEKEDSMSIGIIGAGNVGSALGRAWLGAGEDVLFGIPNPSDPKYGLLPRERLRMPAETARDAEVLVLATPWPATEMAVKSLGDLSGKILIDCTNPLGMGPDGLELVLGYSISGGERVAAWASGAAVFKTLNQTGAENMEKASSFSVRLVMFVA